MISFSGKRGHELGQLLLISPWRTFDEKTAGYAGTELGQTGHLALRSLSPSLPLSLSSIFFSPPSPPHSLSLSLSLSCTLSRLHSLSLSISLSLSLSLSVARVCARNVSLALALSLSLSLSSKVTPMPGCILSS